MDYAQFFTKATGYQPYPYQARLGSESWPDMLDVPTGLGKTSAVTLAWLWKRGWRIHTRAAPVNPGTPRRLVWCLPMRVLVEQTRDSIVQWLKNTGLLGEQGSGRVSVHVLMGGEADLSTWAEHPEEDMVLIGTQDMLLSRALMRGYAMSRYQWPMHFALLHNDCMWVYDEVQLMGAGLSTSAQLEAFRRSFILPKASRSLWVSATTDKNWLSTIDFQQHISSLTVHRIGSADRDLAGSRLNAVKQVEAAPVELNKENNKSNASAYIRELGNAVLEKHHPESQTLVIVNNVERAQRLFTWLKKQRQPHNDLLIHARFRAADRQAHTRKLKQDPAKDRIIVATQAIEAGVDISSRVLFTELAPWDSLVQRFGRCNRYGEHNHSGAHIYWINVESDKALAPPYSEQALDLARARLEPISTASPQSLPAIDSQREPTAVLRRKDLLDLFNTDPDLSGFDVDISDYIRDSGSPGVHVFWRQLESAENGEGNPNQPQPQPGPDRGELCPASMSQIARFIRRKNTRLWHWDTLSGRWSPVSAAQPPRPGMVLLARSTSGGYLPDTGFDATSGKEVSPISIQGPGQNRSYVDDWRSQQNRPVPLSTHLSNTGRQAESICKRVGELDYKPVIVKAALWHDVGKIHPVFQHSMYRCHNSVNAELPLAKSDCTGPMRHDRPYFRHELASMLAWLDQHDGQDKANLIAYLILAHHGKVRMSLRAMPDEFRRYVRQNNLPSGRFARGIWEEDVLPALQFGGETSRETCLKLDLMEIGRGQQGPSWTERSQRLLEEHGPFRLAWLETLVRLADWRASADEQADEQKDNL